ncbi:flavoprotein [Methylophilus sp.]|jgi:dihydromethanopterin reductase (acceptor)|uniref:flavoprotein n=1 Tax=Methylophilus sp. TaxID=29541 RepID=UPI0011D51686|nr:flavoprotein [Methylophilus sp.]TXI47504.1 MAG: flavoprotein [Methylophilus sp.]
MSAQRLAWAITGSGHYLRESLAILQTLQDVDIYLSRAAAEIIQQYGFQSSLEATGHKVYQDKTASSVPVERFYEGVYHTLVISPATSNTIAKMAYGFSDSLVTNLFAQAGKTRVHSILFACDTAPELESEAPRDHMVKVFPRQIDLENVAKLKHFADTTVVEDMAALQHVIMQRLAACHDLHLHDGVQVLDTLTE